MNTVSAKIPFIILLTIAAVNLSAQNVGIGTTTPLQKLQVDGNAYLNGKFSLGSNPGSIAALSPHLNVNGVALFKGRNNGQLDTMIAGVEHFFGRYIYGTGLGFIGASFWKDKEGVVHIQRVIKNGSTALNTVLFTLPTGYRSPARLMRTVLSNNAVSRTDILANGEVIITNTASSLWLNLTGIYFRVT